MKPYEAYKESKLDWLGDIPSHWDLVKLGACFTERNEKVSDKDFAALSVTKNGIRPQMEHVAKSDAGDNRKKVCVGDFVINSRSDRKGSSGTSDYDGSVSLISIILEPRLYEPRFAHHLLRSYNFQEEFYKYGKGIVADLWSTRYSDMKNIVVPLMPKVEQQAIATFLDRETQRIDNLIEEKQNFIKLLKEKRQALISHVVTKGLNPDVEMQDSGIEWIGQVPKHWVVKKIKYDVLGIEQGWSPQCESTPVPNDHTWGVVKVGCVNRGIFNPEQNKKLPEELEPRKEYTIKKGDLLVSRANAKEWVGSAAVPDRDYDNLLLCDKIYRIKLDLEKADPEFFAYYLASDQAREQIEIDATGTSSSMLNIGQGTILNMPIPAPELTEQQFIVRGIKNKTSQIDRLVLEVLDSIELLKEHRTSLISAAVTGKIDVREAV
ncbi:restriction endonuclease subunit S [Dickeya zeae]|uniref:restriction endonuclease subunit S n=1 Tax=Dickeya zeae TaxID=204042 RepID=UPI0003A1F9B1|nr:restriction endonuclease subunit S [Dickeya zeae]